MRGILTRYVVRCNSPISGRILRLIFRAVAFISRRRISSGLASEISDLRDQRVTPQFCELLDHLINRTRDLFLEGYPLLDMVKGRLRFELRLTCLGGMHILKKIRDNDYDVFHRRPTVTKRDLPALLFKTLFFRGYAIMNLKKHIAKIVRGARTNFFYAFVFLPRKKREAIFSVYAFSRHTG